MIKIIKNLKIFYIIIIFIVISGTFYFGIFNRLSEQFEDKLLLPKKADQNIIIVAIDNESLNAIGSWPWPREKFSQVLDNLSQARAIGIDVNFSEPSKYGEYDDQKLSSSISKLKDKVVLPIELDKRDQIVVSPIVSFSDQTVEGFVNIPLSEDGIARFVNIQKGVLQSFDKILAVKSGDQINNPDNFRVRYQGRQGTYLTFSFDDVLEGRIPIEVFYNTTVLIGATAPDLHDTLQTPFGSIPGVEVHANIIQNLKEGKYFSKSPLLINYLLFLIITSLVFYLIKKIKSLTILATSFLILAGFIYGLAAFFFTRLVIIPAIYLLFDLVLSIIISVTLEYLTESKEKKFIRKAFQHYLSPELVNELVNDPNKLVLGGERRRVTVLFSDIRGFTTISESLTPEELTQFMSEYFSAVSPIIPKARGVLDKYIGDAIMAFWGAPLPNENQAYDACQVALSMLEEVEILNKTWTKRGLPEIKIGIGLNTGDVIVGNMGSRERFNYGILGDEVNLASRLEGLTKYYKVHCIVTENTKKEAEVNGMHFRPLDLVLVKGKKESKRLYELLKAPLNDDLENSYLEGLNFYEKGKWNMAIVSFKEGLKISTDGSCKVFLERCEEFLKHPPENWQGVYEFTSK